MNEIRVVHVVEAFGGGIIEFISSITSGLHNYKHIIIHASLKDDINISFGDNVEFLHWAHAQREVSFIKDTKATLSLYKILTALEYDVIHLHSSKAGFIGRMIHPFLKNQRRTIYTPNGLSFLRKDISKVTKFIYVSLEKISHFVSGTIIAVSKSEAAGLKKINIDAYYINNGVKIKNSWEVNPKSGQVVIGTTGRITYQKNPLLFNEIAEYYKNNESLRFIWIGGGELKSELISSNIEVTGWLTKEVAVKKLEGIDIYFSAALWEGLPFAVLDAMNNRKPLVLYDSTGNKDLVINGSNGYKFKSTSQCISALDKLVGSAIIRENYGRSSFSMLKEHFDVEEMCNQYDIAYKGEFEKLKRN